MIFFRHNISLKLIGGECKSVTNEMTSSSSEKPCQPYCRIISWKIYLMLMSLVSSTNVLPIKPTLLIADILYSEHLSTTDTFLKNGWNDGQTLITKPPRSGNFIADTSLQWTSFLGPNSPYPLELTSLWRDTYNIRLFLQEICIHFNLDSVLQFRLSLFDLYYFAFLASLMVFSVP